MCWMKDIFEIKFRHIKLVVCLVSMVLAIGTIYKQSEELLFKSTE